MVMIGDKAFSHWVTRIWLGNMLPTKLNVALALLLFSRQENILKVISKGDDCSSLLNWAGLSHMFKLQFSLVHVPGKAEFKTTHVQNVSSSLSHAGLKIDA